MVSLTQMANGHLTTLAQESHTSVRTILATIGPMTKANKMAIMQVLVRLAIEKIYNKNKEKY